MAGNAYGLTGTPNITVDLLTATDVTVGGAVTISGNLEVQGTQTIINTSTLDIEDKTVAIASTTAATNATAGGSGIEVFASSVTANNNKTILWQNTSNCWEFSNAIRPKGVSETTVGYTTQTSGITTYTDASGNVVLEMDVQAATTYTYTMPSVWSSGRGCNIGIVSFKNMPGDSENGVTVTLITTQSGYPAHGGGIGYANTHDAVGFGATCTIIPVSYTHLRAHET